MSTTLLLSRETYPQLVSTAYPQLVSTAYPQLVSTACTGWIIWANQNPGHFGEIKQDGQARNYILRQARLFDIRLERRQERITS